MTSSIFLRCTLLLALIIGSCAGFSQNNLAGGNADYTITKRLISTEDGLASHEVFCGVQDKSGFLWFGTRNGLNRYDGKNSLLFTRQRNNMQDNKVVQLAQDDVGNLFIEYGSTGFQLATNGKVDVMNAITQEITTLSAAFPKMPFKEQDVYWLSNDGADEINFLTAYPFRLWKYSAKAGFRLRYEIPDWIIKDSLPLVDHRVTGPFCLFGKGTAVLKLTNQLTQYVISQNKVTAFKQKDVLRSLPIGFTDKKELLLTYNTSSSPNEFTVALVQNDGKIDSTIELNRYGLNNVKGRYWFQAASSANTASCMFYIGTDALYLWNENALLKVLSKSELKAFENLFLYQLFADNFGNLWLCTSLGVLQLKIQKNRFQQYFTGRQQNIQTNSQARGIYADETGEVLANIWTNTFMQRDGRMQSSLDEEIKYALTRHDSTLYCGGYNLFRYDDLNNKIVKYPGGQGSEIWSMFAFNDSLLLLGRTNGLALFNSNTNKFDSLQPADKNTPEAKFVYRFFKTNNTVSAVAENGLYTISRINTGWSITKEPSAPISALSLLDAYTDPQGICWIATNGEGLYRWDKKNNQFTQFNITSGLPSDVLYRIEPDDFDNLWISSDYGLIRFNKKTFAVNTYTTNDGISHNEFNRTSSFKAKDGRLFFGGLDGVNAFNPKDFITDTNTLNAPLRIIAFNQFVGTIKGLVNKTTELLNTSQITVEPNDLFFTLEFRLLDFGNNEAYRYGYKIEGQDKDWNYIRENSIRIGELRYGTYTLRIKAQNREGVWSKSELTIPLTVVKPFYLRWWFILLALLLLIAAVYAVIYLRIKQLASDKKKLERTVDERTRQLKQSISAQSDLLQEKDVLIKEIHHRVKNNLQVISGLLELQSKTLNDEAAKEALSEGRNRVRSIALIHQNLYQFESLSSIELKRFVNDLCKQVASVFQKQKPVTMNINVPDMHLDIDSAVPLGLILNELLSNSFKYAFNSVDVGAININIDSSGEGRHRLIYSDSGPGLPADFDLTRAATLGIQLINDLSRQIGGKLIYEKKNGAFFTINFTNRNLRKSQD